MNIFTRVANGVVRFKNEHNCLNTHIYPYLETSGGQSSNLYLNVVHFSIPVLVIYLWQLKTIIFLHCCLIQAAQLNGAGNTNGGSITVLLASCLTGLDLANKSKNCQ